MEERNENKRSFYICTVCKAEEKIPKDVVEYFDTMDQSNVNEPPGFSCEKCGRIMRPKDYIDVYGVKYKKRKKLA